MIKIRTILHPTDFSDCSRLAFRLASLLAREQGARLVILHVKQVLGPMVAYGNAMAQLESGEDQEKHWEILGRFQVSDSRVSVEHRLVEGDAAREIVRVADDVGCDLIVMGSHGRTGLQRLVFGSVAEQVLRKARCPVVTVKVPHGARVRPHPLEATSVSDEPNCGCW